MTVEAVSLILILCSKLIQHDKLEQLLPFDMNTMSPAGGIHEIVSK